MAEGAGPGQREVMPMTCANDCHDHMITLESFAAGRRAGQGMYLAVCGWWVAVATMLEPPHKKCPLCALAMRPTPPQQTVRRRQGVGALLSRFRTGAKAA